LSFVLSLHNGTVYLRAKMLHSYIYESSHDTRLPRSAFTGNSCDDAYVVMTHGSGGASFADLGASSKNIRCALCFSAQSTN